MTRNDKTAWSVFLVIAVCAALLVLLPGCSSVTGSRTLPDGSTLAIRSYRCLWASEGIKTTTKDQNGFTFTLEVQKSNPDAQAIGAVAKGVAEGLAAGAK